MPRYKKDPFETIQLELHDFVRTTKILRVGKNCRKNCQSKVTRKRSQTVQIFNRKRETDGQVYRRIVRQNEESRRRVRPTKSTIFSYVMPCTIVGSLRLEYCFKMGFYFLLLLFDTKSIGKIDWRTPTKEPRDDKQNCRTV